MAPKENRGNRGGNAGGSAGRGQSSSGPPGASAGQGRGNSSSSHNARAPPPPQPGPPSGTPGSLAPPPSQPGQASGTPANLGRPPTVAGPSSGPGAQSSAAVPAIVTTYPPEAPAGITTGPDNTYSPYEGLETRTVIFTRERLDKSLKSLRAWPPATPPAPLYMYEAENAFGEAQRFPFEVKTREGYILDVEFSPRQQIFQEVGEKWRRKEIGGTKTIPLYPVWHPKTAPEYTKREDFHEKIKTAKQNWKDQNGTLSMRTRLGEYTHAAKIRPRIKNFVWFNPYPQNQDHFATTVAGAGFIDALETPQRVRDKFFGIWDFLDMSKVEKDFEDSFRGEIKNLSPAGAMLEVTEQSVVIAIRPDFNFRQVLADLITTHWKGSGPLLILTEYVALGPDFAFSKCQDPNCQGDQGCANPQCKDPTWPTVQAAFSREYRAANLYTQHPVLGNLTLFIRRDLPDSPGRVGS